MGWGSLFLWVSSKLSTRAHPSVVSSVIQTAASPVSRHLPSPGFYFAVLPNFLTKSTSALSTLNYIINTKLLTSCFSYFNLTLRRHFSFRRLGVTAAASLALDFAFKDQLDTHRPNVVTTPQQQQRPWNSIPPDLPKAVQFPSSRHFCCYIWIEAFASSCGQAQPEDRTTSVQTAAQDQVLDRLSFSS